ncbi:hypothetical protein [Alicyclobacillus dauci]|uniref:Uncharacterized protein n=1 Tax=Alicyclobacillus dauci TaxID=1475485 RepID=A0ABY6Z113_9BACL|nr:hypothetical protein [Alicyclobacillus dauci]WAH36051.1 hypothetical protein NZD86_17595 [Alicyclobacillus dauci]
MSRIGTASSPIRLVMHPQLLPRPSGTVARHRVAALQASDWNRHLGRQNLSLGPGNVNDGRDETIITFAANDSGSRTADTPTA